MSTTHQVYDMFLNVPAAEVWEAITSGALSAKYFFGSKVESTFEKGARMTYAFPDGTVGVDGEVLDVDPGKRLVTTWQVHYDPRCAGERSEVTWTVEPRGAMTKLTVVHDCASAPNTASSVANDGWSYVLSSMKSLLETGKALPMPGQG